MWWESLSPEWQQAFRLAVLQKNEAPTEEEMEALQNLTVLRLAGPGAPHSNCSVELTDLSGVSGLKNLQILVVTHHAISNVTALEGLENLKSLFLFNNHISSLKGIEKLQQLEQLYVNSNQLQSIEEVEHLVNLRELYVNDNRLLSLAGLTPQHAGTMQRFICLPNHALQQKSIIHTERELGIMCR